MIRFLYYVFMNNDYGVYILVVLCSLADTISFGYFQWIISHGSSCANKHLFPCKTGLEAWVHN